MWEKKLKKTEYNVTKYIHLTFKASSRFAKVKIIKECKIIRLENFKKTKNINIILHTVFIW